MTPNLMLDDDALTRLLTEAAESFPVPEVELTDLAAKPSVLRSRAARWTAVAAALVGGVLIVQSLGGGTPFAKTNVVASGTRSPAIHSPANTGDGRRAPADSATKTAETASGGSAGVMGSGSSASLPEGQVYAPMAPVMAPPAAPTSVLVPAAPAPFDDGAKIVKTGSIALIVGAGKVGGVVVKVHSIAAGAGGYVANEKSQEYGDDPTSSVTIRIPVDKFEAVVQQVRDQVTGGVGKVDSASTSGQDVTAQYTDVAAQIQSLTASRERFLTILGRANTIGETLAVQQRVDSVQQQIDSLRGRLKVLSDQTSMGTLTVTVSEKPKAEVKPHVQSGLSKSFDNAKHGFTSGVGSLISRSGKGLLVLILAAVGLVILRTGWRLARRRLV